MTFNGFLQIAIYLIVLVLLAKPLGGYMARVYQGEHTLLTRVLGPIERLSYRILGVRRQLHRPMWCCHSPTRPTPNASRACRWS